MRTRHAMTISTAALGALSLLGGCALVYSYGDYKNVLPEPDGGTSGSGASSTTSSGSSSTSAGGTGGAAASSSSSSAASGTSSGSVSSTSTASSAGGCVGGNACVPAAPAGWTMIALATGSPPMAPPCADASWSTQAFTAGGDLTGALACDCTCGAPTGGSCPSVATLNTYGNAACSDAPFPASVSTTCTPLTTAGVEAVATNAAGASCQAGDGNLPPPSFQTLVTGCAPTASPATCPTGVCAPASLQVCVFQEGTPACPTPYTQQSTYHAAFMDERRCNCACGAASGVACTPTTTLYTDADCATMDGTASSVGACATLAKGASKSAEITSVGTPSGGSCAASSSPSGSVSTTGTSYTVCCLP